ncbi:hypothetical protein ACQJBY_010161 [Aegilops geniculata]
MNTCLTRIRVAPGARATALRPASVSASASTAASALDTAPPPLPYAHHDRCLKSAPTAPWWMALPRAGSAAQTAAIARTAASEARASGAGPACCCRSGRSACHTRGEAATTSARSRVAAAVATVSRRRHRPALARPLPRPSSRTKDARLSSFLSMLRQSSCGAAAFDGMRLSAHCSASSSASAWRSAGAAGAAWKTSGRSTQRNPSCSMHARPTSDSDASAKTFLSAPILAAAEVASDWRHRLSTASDGSSSADSGRLWSVAAESQRSMRWRRVRLGTSTAVSPSPRACIVTGQVRWPSASHRSMHWRSYVCPVHSVTGSVKMSRLIGHRNRCGTLIFGTRRDQQESNKKWKNLILPPGRKKRITKHSTHTNQELIKKTPKRWQKNLQLRPIGGEALVGRDRLISRNAVTQKAFFNSLEVGGTHSHATPIKNPWRCNVTAADETREVTAAGSVTAWDAGPGPYDGRT